MVTLRQGLAKKLKKGASKLSQTKLIKNTSERLDKLSTGETESTMSRQLEASKQVTDKALNRTPQVEPIAEIPTPEPHVPQQVNFEGLKDYATSDVQSPRKENNFQSYMRVYDSSGNYADVAPEQFQAIQEAKKTAVLSGGYKAPSTEAVGDLGTYEKSPTQVTAERLVSTKRTMTQEELAAQILKDFGIDINAPITASPKVNKFDAILKQAFQDAGVGAIATATTAGAVSLGATAGTLSIPALIGGAVVGAVGGFIVGTWRGYKSGQNAQLSVATDRVTDDVAMINAISASSRYDPSKEIEYIAALEYIRQDLMQAKVEQRAAYDSASTVSTKAKAYNDLTSTEVVLTVELRKAIDRVKYNAANPNQRDLTELAQALEDYGVGA